MVDNNTIYIDTLRNQAGAIVRWRYKARSGGWTIEQARGKGMDLLSVAAIAQTEAQVTITILKQQNLSPGDKGWTKAFHSTLASIRKSRSKLPSGLMPIFGFRTQQPLVEVCWYGEKITLDLETARSHAAVIIQGAESAQTDAWLSFSFGEWGVVEEIRERIFESFLKFREEVEQNEIDC